MLPRWHIILGGILSVFLFYFIQLTVFQATIIFLSAFLIDFDHYVGYVLQRRKTNLRNALKWMYAASRKWHMLSKKQQSKYKITPMFFHGIEFIILLTLLSLANKIFLFILIGVSFHLILDWSYAIYKRELIYPKTSIIYTLVKNKNKKLFEI